MRRIVRADGPSRLGNKSLPQMLLSDYQQATVTLDQLAIMFRTRESQLRKLITSPEETSSFVKIGVTAYGKAVDRTPTIAFFCLGKFRVEVQGTIVDTRGRTKALRLLKFLIQHRRSCTRETIVEMLWPESEPEAAFNRLRVEVHTLRQIFASSVNRQHVIVYHDGCYELNPNIHSWVDANEFETLYRQGARFETDDRRSEAIQSYEQAELLYQGDYLEEDLYEEWTLLRRESLRDAYLYLLGKLASWYMEEGNHGSCISYCHKILAQDPYREDTYRLLMRCYVALGQKTNALHWYDVCHANLQKGLDADPSAETTNLQRQIMAREE